MTTAIIDPRPDAFIQVDATGVITEWGLEAQRTYGWLREEILGRSAELLFPENQRGLCRKLLYEWPGSEKDIICGSPFEGLALHRDGAVFPVEVTVLRIQSAGFGIALFVRDRSGSRRLQTELARSESRYRAILEKLALEHRRLTDHLAFQASHDSLTGLPNRSRFEKKLREAMTRTDPGNDSRQAALICLDLDRFKSVNDMLGHPVGDLLLREVSRRFLSAIPAACTLARLAGDAFGVVVPDSGLRQARCLAQQLQNSLKTPLIVAGHQLRLSASVGIAMYPADGADQISLLRNADQAMYRAKIRDPGEVRFYCREMGEEESEKVEIENHLRVALDRGGLEIFYQPQFTSKGELSGLEALLRFRHPALGWVPPSRFIPIAEKTGLIVAVGTWVLREVCLQGVRWAQEGYAPVPLAVNVSALQFSQPGFADLVREILAETGLPPEILELELTETIVMSKLRESTTQMRQLRAIGVSIAIDDFGTGYSSLNYLHHLEVDRLKIDRSFVQDLDAPVTSLPVVQAIIALAHSFRKEVIAEGVETEAQLRILKEAGCELVQGFFFARPVPGHLAENFLKPAETRAETTVVPAERMSVQLHSLMHSLDPVISVSRVPHPSREHQSKKMHAENLSDLFERGLEFAWDCEHHLIEQLPKMADAAQSEALRDSILQHIVETKTQIERLRRIFDDLHRAPASETAESVRAISAEASRLIHHIEPSPLRDAALIFAGNQIEHYEIALYGSLTAFARTLGNSEAASLLSITLREEKEADRQLTALAESSVNREAWDFHNAPPFAFI